MWNIQPKWSYRSNKQNFKSSFPRSFEGSIKYANERGFAGALCIYFPARDVANNNIDVSIHSNNHLKQEVSCHRVGIVYKDTLALSVLL